MGHWQWANEHFDGFSEKKSSEEHLFKVIKIKMTTEGKRVKKFILQKDYYKILPI